MKKEYLIPATVQLKLEASAVTLAFASGGPNEDFGGIGAPQREGKKVGMIYI